MIHVDRPELQDPAALKLVQRAGIAKQVLIDSFGKCTKPQVDDNIYRGYKDYLLGAFHHKCAYCESVISSAQPGDVEHYRPKNRVMDQSSTPVRAEYPGFGMTEHMGYFWLAYDWDNLLPSCAECNRYRTLPNGISYGKWDRFPVSGFRACLPGEETKEVPLLLDPTRCRPNEHFTFFSDGTMQAKTDAGLQTIELLGLNTREILVRERRSEYRDAARALTDFINEARGFDDVRIEELRVEVNQIWNGETPYAAFGKLALGDLAARYARLGMRLELPIPGIG